MKPSLLFPFSFFALAACGTSKSDVAGTADGGPSGADGGGLPDTGAPGLPDAATPAACPDDNVTSISGTWDIAGVGAAGTTTNSVLVVDASTFRFESGGKSLEFKTNAGAMTLTWTDGSKNVPITTTRTATTVGTGLLPLDLGGTWKFESQTDTQGCGATLAPTTLDGDCNVSGTPLGTIKGAMHGERTSALPSIFGELGGTWHLTMETGTVDVTVSGNTFHAVGVSTKKIDGTLDVKVCNGTASGVTSNGFEFAATRR